LSQPTADFWISYFKNGAQINSPVDREIAQSIEENLVPWPKAWDDFGLEQYMERNAYHSAIVPYIAAIHRYTV
jgi:phosphoglucomutase